MGGGLSVGDGMFGVVANAGIHPGVYATFTGQVGRQARMWAALLYAGEGARLSHETAAELTGLADRP